MKVFGDIGQIPTDWFGAPPKCGEGMGGL